MVEKVYIYGDEFGTSTLKNNDVKNITNFIYSAIVIKQSNIKEAIKVRNEISKKYFQGNIIKSKSRVLQNIDKRIEILEYLVNNLNFIIYTIVIDKTKLDKDNGGLRFRKVFYKYFHNIFFSLINNNFNDFELHMDNLINEEYQIELKKYIYEKFQNSFFENYNISDDKKEPLIQLADLIAGSLGRVYNQSFQEDKSENLFRLLSPKMGKTIFFPAIENNEVSDVKYENKIEEEIFKIARQDTIDMLNNEGDIIIKNVLEILLWHQKFMPHQYIQTYEMINSLKLNTGKDITIENLRIIIRDLRFKGVIVVSSSSKSGYKLPVNKSDVHIYFSHYLKYVIPMLKKVEIANSVFMNKTVGDYIPLEEMEELKKLVETISIKK